jgi:sugar/nucleoside kinase (ribokinase family)
MWIMDTNERLDFVAIGDIVTDAFIELSDAWIEDDNPTKSKELCMRFGDKIPYSKVDVVKAVGNSPNAAVSAHRLGLSSAIITDVGDDDIAEDTLKALAEEGVSSEFVTKHTGVGSNYHYVLRYGAERTILVKHYAYEYALPATLAARAPKWIYLSSLAENSLPYHDQIADFLEANPDTKLAFQPGTFQIKLGAKKLARLYKQSDIFFCNKEEAQRITGSTSDDMKVLMAALRALGPELVVVSDGPNGAYAFNGTTAWRTPMYPDPKPPVDRTGAGDSFSSTFVSAIILGKTVPEALAWGPINSMSVVQYVGAQKGLLTREALLDFLSKGPADYKVEQI